MSAAKFIPMRLSMEQRKKLRLIEAALNVSEYTDHVDIISHVAKGKRVFLQLRDICAILSGLLVARYFLIRTECFGDRWMMSVMNSDYNVGQKLIKNKEFHEFSDFFQDLFEIGRRHKIRNPGAMFLVVLFAKREIFETNRCAEKMRDAYGKLIYLLQDSQMEDVQEVLQFRMVRKIRYQ